MWHALLPGKVGAAAVALEATWRSTWQASFSGMALSSVTSLFPLGLYAMWPVVLSSASSFLRCSAEALGCWKREPNCAEGRRQKSHVVEDRRGVSRQRQTWEGKGERRGGIGMEIATILCIKFTDGNYCLN